MTRRHIAAWNRYCAGKSDVADPAISPVHTDPTGFPPLLLIVGDQEVMLDDSLRVEAKARDAGVDVEVCIGRGMQHDFPLLVPLPVAGAAGRGPPSLRAVGVRRSGCRADRPPTRILYTQGERPRLPEPVEPLPAGEAKPRLPLLPLVLCPAGLRHRFNHSGAPSRWPRAPGCLPGPSAAPRRA